MKTLILPAFLIFSLWGCPQLAEAQSDEDQLKQLIQDSFDEIFSGLDTASIRKFYTADFLLLENGIVWNNDTITNYMLRRKNATGRPVRTNRFEFIEVKVNEGTAWLAYHNYADLNYPDGRERKLYWLESATAVRASEGWKLDMLHSTRNTPPE